MTKKKENMEKKHMPINIEHVDMNRLKELSTDIPNLIRYAHERGGFSIVPTESGVIKGKAMSAMKEQTQMQMDIIYEQMKTLAAQVEKIKERALVSELVYGADINFEPVIGEKYYLYERENGKAILSLVAPEEWRGESKLGLFLHCVRLLADHTWVVVEEHV